MLARFDKSDVELLYWLGASWLGAIANGKDDMQLVGELPRAARVLERALALDESWDKGTIHEIFILLDAGQGDGKAAAEEGRGALRARARARRR